LTTSATPDSAPGAQPDHEHAHDHDVAGPAITPDGLRDHAATHAADSNAPDVHISGVTAKSCEVGVRVAGDLRSSSGGNFTGATVSGVTVTGGSTAQVRDPKVTNPAQGAWVIGRSSGCVNVDSRAHYAVKVTNVSCNL